MYSHVRRVRATALRKNRGMTRRGVVYRYRSSEMKDTRFVTYRISTSAGLFEVDTDTKRKREKMSLGDDGRDLFYSPVEITVTVVKLKSQFL